MPRRRPRWRTALLCVALAATSLCVAAPVARATVGPQQIDAFLIAHDSPLSGEGEAFYGAGRRNGVDPAFLVAISGAESGFGRYLFSAGSQTADHNAFNWFFAATRAGSAFAGWGQAITTVAAGLRGPLYYGAGRYAVGAIAPIYCPQGTQAWIDNVTAYMLALGADPNDTRWHDTPASPTARPVADYLRIFGPAGDASALVVRRPIALVPLRMVAGDRLHIRFTLTNAGVKTGSWKAVILRLQGPAGQAMALGSHAPLRLRAGASYGFVATPRLRASGVWRGWIDVETADGAILAGMRPALRLTVARASTERHPAATRGQRGRDDVVFTSAMCAGSSMPTCPTPPCCAGRGEPPILVTQTRSSSRRCARPRST